MKRSLLHMIPLVLLGASIPGCFTCHEISVAELRGMSGKVVVQIHLKTGEELRGVLEPTEVDDETILYRRLRYDPESWVVRYGGWPMMYTSGRTLRYETDGGEVEKPRSSIDSVYLEEYSWWLTILSLPVTLPVGIIDFTIGSLAWGFDDVDTSFDSFGRKPRRQTDLERG